VRREIWLNREAFARLESLTAALRLRQRELASLPLYYEDPDFEREHERVGRELDRWLRTDLPAVKSWPTPSGACSGSGAGGAGFCDREGLPGQGCPSTVLRLRWGIYSIPTVSHVALVEIIRCDGTPERAVEAGAGSRRGSAPLRDSVRREVPNRAVHSNTGFGDRLGGVRTH